MHRLLKSPLIPTLLGALLLAPALQAQLLLTGNVTGKFTDTAGPNDTIYNADDGSSAWIKSGIPENPTDLQTQISFTQKTFTNIGAGLVADDIFQITNGRTLLTSTATAAHFDMWLNLTEPVTHSSLLTSISFTILNTPNGPDPAVVPDDYTITASPIAPLKIDDTLVQFKFVAPSGLTITENESAPAGSLWVTFTPVPEPSTYSAIGAALLAGLVGYRVLRRRRVQAAVPNV